LEQQWTHLTWDNLFFLKKQEFVEKKQQRSTIQHGGDT